MVMRLQVALLITHHYDELLLLCCTSMMTLFLVKLIRHGNWLYFSDETIVGSTHHNDELVLLCCTSVMRLKLEVLITMMSWYYCSGCSQDLLDDIQIATMDVDYSWPFILSCTNSVLMVSDLQLFLHRAILPKEKSCLELKKS